MFMSIRMRLLVLSILLFLPVILWAQQGSSNRGNFRGHHHGLTESGFRMKSRRTSFHCLDHRGKHYPARAIGLKMGDPFAVTTKLYFNRNHALVVDVGQASSGLYNRYFREKFPYYYQGDSLTLSAALGAYIAHRVKSDWLGEVKWLYHLNPKSVSPALKMYFGLGVEWRMTFLRYDYLSPLNAIESRAGSFTERRFTFGPEWVAGIEYSQLNFPISAFMEMEVFYDVKANPGWRRVQGGAGLRYFF